MTFVFAGQSVVPANMAIGFFQALEGVVPPRVTSFTPVDGFDVRRFGLFEQAGYYGVAFPPSLPAREPAEPFLLRHHFGLFLGLLSLPFLAGIVEIAARGPIEKGPMAGAGSLTQVCFLLGGFFLLGGAQTVISYRSLRALERKALSAGPEEWDGLREKMEYYRRTAAPWRWRRRVAHLAAEIELKETKLWLDAQGKLLTSLEKFIQVLDKANARDERFLRISKGALDFSKEISARIKASPKDRDLLAIATLFKKVKGHPEVLPQQIDRILAYVEERASDQDSTVRMKAVSLLELVGWLERAFAETALKKLADDPVFPVTVSARKALNDLNRRKFREN